MKSSSKQFNHINCNQTVFNPILFEARPKGQSRVTMTQTKIIREQTSLIRQQTNTVLIRKLTRKQTKLNSQANEQRRLLQKELTFKKKMSKVEAMGRWHSFNKQVVKRSGPTDSFFGID